MKAAVPLMLVSLPKPDRTKIRASRNLPAKTVRLRDPSICTSTEMTPPHCRSRTVLSTRFERVLTDMENQELIGLRKLKPYQESHCAPRGLVGTRAGSTQSL